MGRLEKRTQTLRELPNPLGLSDSVVKVNELTKTRAYWRNQSRGDFTGLADEAVDLVISPPGNVARLLGFICQLEKVLDGHDTYGSVMRIVPSGHRGVVITISGQPSRVSNLIDRLGDMPGVEKVEMEPAISGIPRRFEFLTKPGSSPSSRVVRVTLEPTDQASQVQATVKDTDVTGRDVLPVLV